MTVHPPTPAEISIHALREESDTDLINHDGKHDISIHALREESDAIRLGATGVKRRFQSTLSVRRATNEMRNSHPSAAISIHALREESDCRFPWFGSFLFNFNPRSP